MKPTKYKTSDGRELWKFQIYIGRDPITKKQINKKRGGFKTQNDALIAYAKMLEERDNGAFSPNALRSENVTIQMLYEKWHEEYAPTVERSTLSKVESYFNNHILPDMGSFKVKEITPGQLQAQLNKWALEAKSGIVWGRQLRQLFKYALLHEVIFRNPFDVIDRPKKINTKRERKFENFLNGEQLSRFLNYWKSQRIERYAYFRLMAYTGLHRGEALALTWDDIDFKNQTLRINKSIAQDYRNGRSVQYLKETKSSSSNRTISLDKTTLEIMQKFQKVSTPTIENIIWVGKFTHSYMNFNVPERWLQDMRQALPDSDKDLKNITLHGLRHTHATLLFEQAARNGKSAPIKAVQKRLGHADVSLTLSIYTHATSREDEIIDDIINDGLDK
ncbi:MAG: tyrosine-type recombinase/integrase [Weissella confusa]